MLTWLRMATLNVDLLGPDGEVLHPAGTEVAVVGEEDDGRLLVEVRVVDNRLASGARYEHFTVGRKDVDGEGA